MCDYRQLNTGVGVMCGWCLAYCTGVVLNTVRESATSDSKENKQADAGSGRFRRHFLCSALLCNCSSTEHEEGLSTHVQRECSAEPFMRSILSLRIFTSRPGSRVRFFMLLLLLCCCCLYIKNRSDLYPVPFSFLLFKAKKRISVVTS